jgi:hypothetical protein
VNGRRGGHEAGHHAEQSGHADREQHSRPAEQRNDTPWSDRPRRHCHGGQYRRTREAPARVAALSKAAITRLVRPNRRSAPAKHRPSQRPGSGPRCSTEFERHADEGRTQGVATTAIGLAHTCRLDPLEYSAARRRNAEDGRPRRWRARAGHRSIFRLANADRGARDQQPHLLHPGCVPVLALGATEQTRLAPQSGLRADSERAHLRAERRVDGVLLSADVRLGHCRRDRSHRRRGIHRGFHLHGIRENPRARRRGSSGLDDASLRARHCRRHTAAHAGAAPRVPEAPRRARVRSGPRGGVGAQSSRRGVARSENGARTIVRAKRARFCATIRGGPRFVQGSAWSGERA